jgi:dynein heavy chain, axonemal
MFKDEGLKVLKLSGGSTYQKDMEAAIIQGYTVLIEDISEEIDPGLDSILTKSIYTDEGLQKINFGGRALIYDDRFRLFITTKLPNPHFLPEICIKMTVINFTVTFDGLEE